MVGAGIGRLRKPSHRTVSLGMIGLLSVPLLWNYYHSTHKEPLREIISRVEAMVKPGDTILIMPLGYKRFVFDYYLTRKDIPTRGVSYESINNGELKKLVDLMKQYQRIWIILCQGDDIDPLLKKNFPIKFDPAETKVTSYFNFQARNTISIFVYLLENKDIF
jgi:hypothetical protein